MSVTAIIPARYAATRLPGKPLLDQTGKPLIQHVVEAVQTAERIDRIVVATDDDRIAAAVAAFGGEAVMTSEDCASGTDRLAQAAAAIGLSDEDIVINVQGDEPDMPGECIDRLADLMQTTDAPMATLATPLPASQAGDPNKVKVALTADGQAMYFSRAPIPFDREGEGAAGHLLHLGIYGYRAGFLKTFAALTPTPAEQAEKLEQLRALEHGHAIAVAVVEYAGGGIDTPADYADFVARQTS
jgi:3-deoxy-manno-octulosonate cytidylyltransferase (CMP-KDO synthetase)